MPHQQASTHTHNTREQAHMHMHTREHSTHVSGHTRTCCGSGAKAYPHAPLCLKSVTWGMYSALASLTGYSVGGLGIQDLVALTAATDAACACVTWAYALLQRCSSASSLMEPADETHTRAKHAQGGGCLMCKAWMQQTGRVLDVQSRACKRQGQRVEWEEGFARRTTTHSSQGTHSGSNKAHLDMHRRRLQLGRRPRQWLVQRFPRVVGRLSRTHSSRSCWRRQQRSLLPLHWPPHQHLHLLTLQTVSE